MTMSPLTLFVMYHVYVSFDYTLHLPSPPRDLFHEYSDDSHCKAFLTLMNYGG
jgi:hypothetical protein